MGSNLHEYRLEDCMEAIIDYRGKTPKKTTSGIPLITAKIIKNGRVQEVNEFIAEEDYDSWMRRGIPKAGDVVLTTEAPLGEVAQLDDRKIALAQRVITLRGKKGLLDNDYLKYLLLSKEVQHQLDGRGTGTTVKGIKQSELREIKLRFPEFDVQRGIAHVLKTLDDKIELNRQTNQTLEQMAQALFKCWFVDFDPVIDNALAANNDIPDALQYKAEQRLQAQQLPDFKPLPDDIRALFPSEFEQTDEPNIGIAGWIPKGWNFGSMKQHANIVMGQSPKGDTYNNEGLGTPLVNGPVEFGDYFTKKSKWTSAPTKLSQKGDLIVCVRGSTTGRFVKSDGVYCLGRGVCSVRGMRSQIFTDLIFKNSIEHLLGLATGSTFPNWSRQILNEFKVILPCTQIVDAFDKLLSENLKKIELNVVESKALNNLRDTLLPKLISGELSVENNC